MPSTGRGISGATVSNPFSSPKALPLLMFTVADSMPGIYTYDAEGDADNAVCQYLQSQGNVDSNTIVAKGIRDKWWSCKSLEGGRDSALARSKL
jgi:hypothetical protein